MSQYLFTYGTLRLNANHPMAGKLAEKSELVGLGFVINAKLFKVDWYPALVPSNNKRDVVVGDVYELKDPWFLDELDDYEGIGIGEKPYEYRRELVEVFTERGELECWIYWYNRPLPADAEIIESGDFLNP
jgi:gamma-glutamylcyclotransferase (GGCT)/AIG2-like uncharacterized protein YtfP